MLTKKEMISRINALYGEKSKMALWFFEIAKNSDYKRTRFVFFKIIAKYNN